MSIAPPGYPTDQTNPGSGNRPADDNAGYEFKSVQALRGRESRAKAKWQNQGWELVSEDRGTVRTELNFRRAKPKTVGAYLMGFVAAFGRLQPKTQSVLVASCALVLAAGIIGIAVGTRTAGAIPSPRAAQATATTAPPAESPATSTTVDEQLDDAEPSVTPEPSERRAKARPRVRAERSEQALRRRNTARLQSATCAEIGETDILVEPGADIDRDGDGVGCES